MNSTPIRYDFVQHAGANHVDAAFLPNVKQRKLLHNLNVATPAEGKSVAIEFIYMRENFAQFRWSADTSFVNIGHLAYIYKFPIVSVFLACLPST